MDSSANSKDPAGVDRDRPLYQRLSTDKKQVAYFYDSDIGNYAYVTGHPMKPHRIRLAHSLVMNYNIYKFLEVYVSYALGQFIASEVGLIVNLKPLPPNADGLLMRQTYTAREARRRQ